MSGAHHPASTEDNTSLLMNSKLLAYLIIALIYNCLQQRIFLTICDSSTVDCAVGWATLVVHFVKC